MRSLHGFAISGISLLLLAACTTTNLEAGRDFDADTFAVRVVRGQTTRDQVRSWLGEPSSTGVVVETNGDRFEEWTYFFAQGALSSLSATRLKTLQVKIDSQGIVRGYDLSQSLK